MASVRILNYLPSIENTQLISSYNATSPELPNSNPNPTIINRNRNGNPHANSRFNNTNSNHAFPTQQQQFQLQEGDQSLLYYGSDKWQLEIICQLGCDSTGQQRILLPFQKPIWVRPSMVNEFEIYSGGVADEPELAAQVGSNSNITGNGSGSGSGVGGRVLYARCVFDVWLFVLNECLVLHFPRSLQAIDEMNGGGFGGGHGSASGGWTSSINGNNDDAEGGIALALAIPYEKIIMCGIQNNLTSLYVGVCEVEGGKTAELYLKPDVENGSGSGSDYALFVSFRNMSNLNALQMAYAGVNELFKNVI
ncbi:unnamed protein product [Ambrosiozyma monospora]|uniref:Unnamed protein product n=1 Tax=Ambrosiozyma monospora TaxID=43982 RepID=A0ACB5TAM3_AMBMO|nr:unnamed protein product [Ambrosiozyma monospora]